jgi:hypothetical protein
MPVRLNHTIVWCRDKRLSSALLVRILGCSPAIPLYNFMVVQLANDVSLDFMEKGGLIAAQHYAFLIEERADPMKSRPNEINHGDGGRGEFDGTFSRIRDEGLSYWAFILKISTAICSRSLPAPTEADERKSCGAQARWRRSFNSASDDDTA